MSTFKKKQVVMLPTNQKAKINEMYFLDKLILSKGEYAGEISQHLYFLSDEEIKEGDWFMYGITPHTIRKCTKIESINIWDNKNSYPIVNCKKIIATTDTSLEIWYFEEIKSFPQPSQSFIERYIENYNRGNIITEVMVEYEMFLYTGGYLSLAASEDYRNNPKNHIYELKTDSKNTITIKRVKESWNKEEMQEALIDFAIKAFNSHDGSISFRKRVEEMSKTYL